MRKPIGYVTFDGPTIFKYNINLKGTSVFLSSTLVHVVLYFDVLFRFFVYALLQHVLSKNFAFTLNFCHQIDEVLSILDLDIYTERCRWLCGYRRLFSTMPQSSAKKFRLRVNNVCPKALIRCTVLVPIDMNSADVHKLALKHAVNKLGVHAPIQIDEYARFYCQLTLL